MEYVLLPGSGPEMLEKTVRKHIGEGWEPLGAPFLADVYWVQAMIRRAPAKPEEKPEEELFFDE